jgi:protein-S-isoprenylcysteine O-methyltransferase Ste14
MSKLNVRVGNFLFRYRNGLGPILFLLALLVGRPTFPWDSAELNLLLDCAGIALALVGQALRIVTIGFEYIERGGRNRQVYASKLVQGGIFAQCRNPLYVGNVLLAIGLALVVNSAVFYLLVLPLVGYAYVAIVAAEEAFLREKFGAEYTEYCRRVRRWIPRLHGWRRAVAGMRFNWRRVLVKEYNTMFVVLLTLAAVKLWADYQVLGSPALPAPATMALAFVAWLGGYLTVRTAKKTGYVKP